MNPQLRRMLLDLGPLLVFFVAYKFLGIFAATASAMITAPVALGIGYALEKRVMPMPVITALLALIFGGLTLYLKSAVFIKIKVTVIYSIFAAILLGGLAFKRLYIKYLFGQAFELDEPGWRQLTWRWGIFFLALALLNEIVWRHASTDIWVDFKTWGIIPLIFLFALAQTPLVMKHHIEGEKTVD